MDTKVVKIDADNIDYDILNEAAKIIQNGGTVVFPTETVYGLGADALNEEACAKIFKAKNRPADNPLIVHICDINDIKRLVEDVPEGAYKLAKSYWPGPLTMAFVKKPIIKDIVTAGLNTVGIRMPNNKIALELIRLSGTPIAAPSANTSGKPSPTQASHVIDDMYGKVDMIIDGGSTAIGLESSFVDMSVEVPMILRPGKITSEDIISILGECDYDPAVIKSDEKIVPKSPGQKYTHYSPKAKVITFKGDIDNVARRIQKSCDYYIKAGYRVGIMATDQTKELYKNGIVESLGDRSDLSKISPNLFSQLRGFDKLGVDIILSEAFEDKGFGKAIMNRLGKASSEIIDADKLNILFLCTGNTCRSIMAEGIMNHTANKNGIKINAFSAGINVLEDDTASQNAIAVMKEIALDISNHIAKQLTEEMVHKADIIFTMTALQKKAILVSCKEAKSKTYTLREYAFGDKIDIIDPYGSNIEAYRVCRNEIGICINSCLNKLIENLH